MFLNRDYFTFYWQWLADSFVLKNLIITNQQILFPWTSQNKNWLLAIPITIKHFDDKRYNEGWFITMQLSLESMGWEGETNTIWNVWHNQWKSWTVKCEQIRNRTWISWSVLYFYSFPFIFYFDWCEQKLSVVLVSRFFTNMLVFHYSWRLMGLAFDEEV